MDPVRLGVLGAGLWCVLALGWQYRVAKGFGKRVLFSRPAGDPRAGIRYVFLKGMAPQAKESVMLHLPSYAAGLGYHAGVFASLALLAVRAFGVQVQPKAAWLLGCLALLGALCGTLLLLKRMAASHLRGISTADDFLANVLVTSFLALAFGAVWIQGAERAWLLEGIVLLVYAPLGKIRHCLFFFPTRYHLGAFLGRRGVFPPTARPAEAGKHHG